MSKLLSSTVSPSAFSPSTSSMRTDVGAIETPSTISTAPPKSFAARHGFRRRGTTRPALHLDGRYGSCAALQPNLSGPYEVLIRARRRRSALALILRPCARAAVGMFGRAGQPQDAQLTDLHTRPERDRQVGDVGELQGDVTAKAGIDEAGGRMGQQPQASQRRLALQPARQVLRKRAQLQRRTKHELSGMQHEGFSVDRFHQAGQLVLLLRGVDVGVAGVVEHPEQAVEANIDAGRLDQSVVERVNSQPAGGDFGPKVAIGEQHATSVSARLWLAELMNDVTPGASLPKQPSRCR